MLSSAAPQCTTTTYSGIWQLCYCSPPKSNWYWAPSDNTNCKAACPTIDGSLSCNQENFATNYASVTPENYYSNVISKAVGKFVDLSACVI